MFLISAEWKHLLLLFLLLTFNSVCGCVALGTLSVKAVEVRSPSICLSPVGFLDPTVQYW
jgi:hypothetical protein